jgi:hypothetical protein
MVGVGGHQQEDVQTTGPPLLTRQELAGLGLKEAGSLARLKSHACIYKVRQRDLEEVCIWLSVRSRNYAVGLIYLDTAANCILLHHMAAAELGLDHQPQRASLGTSSSGMGRVIGIIGETVITINAGTPLQAQWEGPIHVVDGPVSYRGGRQVRAFDMIVGTPLLNSMLAYVDPLTVRPDLSCADSKRVGIRRSPL